MIPRVPLLVVVLLLAGCGGLPSIFGDGGKVSPGGTAIGTAAAPPTEPARNVVVFALGLMETGYRFGGKNPEAGLDCSGMVSYVFDKAAGLRLKGSAADIAQHGRSVSLDEIKPGDLVFFNTRQRPHSHVGIYIGDGRFVHAPSSKGSVRAESLYTGWFASRFEEARSYLE